jgi:hypothetical protein
MPPVGKELEHQPIIDDVAVREVEGYIDRIEKQTEVPAADRQSQPQPAQIQSQPQSQDMGKTVAAQFAHNEKPKIILPLNKDEIEKGSKAGVYDSFKWLSTWCVYMIKKYPGRVFYSQSNSNQ